MKIKVQARCLNVGDIVGSGERVEAIRSLGLDLPKGKTMVVLSNARGSRTTYWGSYTQIGVLRNENGQ